MRTSSILIVDDDPKIRALLRSGLENHDTRVFEASDADAALAFVARHHVDLVTLDLGLGADDGLDLAKRLRRMSTVPIVIVSDKNDVIDKVVGLELGADDYITKPFHLREVAARVKSVLRRTQVVGHEALCTCNPPCNCGQAQNAETLAFDGFTARPSRFELIDRDGRAVDLTSGDYKLLNVFLMHPKRVLSRDQLMDLTGGHDWAPLDRTIDNQVARLRKKIERDPAHPRLIKTVRGIGYMWASDAREVGQVSVSKA